jgi:iron complex outermembrane receptor protein
VKPAKLAQALSLIFVVGSAWAQQDVQKGERIEITGSSIKRIQDEGALPVQTITRQDIERRGFVSAEQLLMSISANGTGADNLSSNVGIQLGTTDRNNLGNSSANLRGLGASSTLVLLNGRRVVNHGAKGNAVDLNSIPLAAIERVEILKDGASAIYGTDAIGGVINFILRKDYQGAEISGYADMTEAGGGNVYRGSLLAGWGDLSKDRWNVMAMISYDKQEKLRGQDRSFVNGFQPDRGLSPDTVGAPFATQRIQAGSALGANFVLPGSTQAFSRANLLSFQGRCDSVPTMSQYQYVLWNAPGFRYACAYDYGGAEILIQPVDRTQFVGRATWQFSNNHQAIFEATASRVDSTKQFEEIQITSTGSNFTMAYPVSGPYYQDLSQFIPSFNNTRPIAFSWRCMACGPRTINTVTDAYRVLFALEGTIGGRWDYKLGLSTQKSEADSTLLTGYMFTPLLVTAMSSGLVNPWLQAGQSQTAAGQAILNAASASGTRLFGGEATMSSFDGAISGDVWTLPGGTVSAAVGFDTRRETYKFDDGSRTALPVFLAPFDPDFAKASRTVKAVYGEIAVPILKSLEVTGAVRHDEYSDFGGTTNPKVSLRFHPIDPVLFRASYNEGFRAPSFFQLYTAVSESQIPGNISDPVLCPNGPGPGADLNVCAIRPNGRAGGNPNLKPETSKQWQVGVVVSPVPWITASVDLWQIKRYDHIYELTPQQVIANYQTFPENLVRGANGLLTDPGAYIQAGFVNASGDITKGIDVSGRVNGRVWTGKWSVGIDGTYLESYRSRVFDSQPFTEFAGQWSSRDIYPRWKHVASASFDTGPWNFTLYQQYTAHYRDERPPVPPAGFDEWVHSYTTYHLTATYTGIRNLTIGVGVKNLLDKDPPFTAHNVDFAAGAGWDPRVADPRGRAYTARVTYRFR